MPPSFFTQYSSWLVAGLIVGLGLFVYGLRDVLRFSWKRVWAISSVNFAESIRRRVLWITPLAIVGIILVSQLSNPIDEQDAIRQTTKFALFTSGLLVTITAIILACTNLPREIESRVIYTVVTKPTTRLEIILGKIIGFARVSATILLIMGVFTLGYLHVRAWSLRNYIAHRLDAGDVDVISKPTLEYYRQAGLLSARQYERPDGLQIYSRLPAPADERRWFAGAGEGSFVVPFNIPYEDLVREGTKDEPAPLAMVLLVGFQKGAIKTELEQAEAAPTTLPYLIQNPDATAEQVRVETREQASLRARQAARGLDSPSVQVNILDRNLNSLVDPKLINSGRPVALTDANGEQPVGIALPPQAVMQMMQPRASGVFFVEVTGATSGYEYSAAPTPILMVDQRSREIAPMPDPRPDRAGKPLPAAFRSRMGTFGQQLRGAERGVIPVAEYKFRDARATPSSDGLVPFELRVGIERSDADPSEEQPTVLELTFVEHAKTATTTPKSDSASHANSASASAAPVTQPSVGGTTVRISPETNRTSYFTVPASAIGSGDFDVYVRALTPGHYVGVQNRSLAMVTSDQSFGFNLFKSMLVLWLLSLLVIIVSVFASTFVSWPIAIVLTLLILLGRWGVDQLGDALAPGIGNAFVTDFFHTKDVNVAVTVSNTVEVLTRFLRIVASVLPDISQFSAIEDLERGVAVSLSRLSDSAMVILVFGLPMIVLSYIFLRHKEVAP